MCFLNSIIKIELYSILYIIQIIQEKFGKLKIKFVEINFFNFITNCSALIRYIK